VSDRKALDAGPAHTAIQSACVEALVGANLLAIGVVRNGKLLHVSPALTRMFGLAPDETPTSFSALIDDSDRELVEQALASPGEVALGLRALRADGSRFDVEMSATRATLPDGPALVVALFDITGHGQRRAAPPPAGTPPVRVQWGPRFEVGIDVIDGQHRHLLELINRLQDALSAGSELEQLVESLRQLVRYTEHHFATEERLMDEVGATAERHRGEHRHLLEGLMRFTVKLDTTSVSESSHFLQDWLFRHIDEVDRPFGALLRSRGQY
jgi:hemerythrin-like metal-binding protein/PAS domain S-box-containing protein